MAESERRGGRDGRGTRAQEGAEIGTVGRV